MKTRPCPDCDAAPEMDMVGTSPRPDGYRIILECPACGNTLAVDPEDNDDGGGWA